MNHNVLLIIGACGMTVTAWAAPAPSPPLTAENLRREYQENPLRIDSPQPRLGWELISAVRNQRQTAYHILAASRPGIMQLRRDDLGYAMVTQEDVPGWLNMINRGATSVFSFLRWDLAGTPFTPL
jgi:hypothetical protein